MEYLGHIISTQGMAPDPTKVSTVAWWPVSYNGKDVQAFLGMTGYYECFVCNHADLAAPLSDLLKKECTWQWIEWEQSAFEGLKTALTTEPVSVYSYFTHAFSYAMDALDIEVRTLLQQDHSNGPQPLQFFSKKLNSAEKNYTVGNCELLAIVLCIVKW